MNQTNTQMNKGRPKQPKEPEELNFTTFQEDITMFKNSLIDYINDEDVEDQHSKDVITNFLNKEQWKQNIYIVYLLNKDKKSTNNKFTFKALAQLLQIQKSELMRAIRTIKKELAEI